MSETIAYDKSEVRALLKAFKVMDSEAVDQAKATGYELAGFAASEIAKSAQGRRFANKAVTRVAEGVKVSKTSKLGEFSYGFASQRFSGGGNTKQLWAGYEFGSDKFKQFPSYSGRQGRGSRGWFIYPTLRRIQPDYVNRWETALDRIIKEWS